MVGMSGVVLLGVVAVSTTTTHHTDNWYLDQQARPIVTSGSTIYSSRPLVWLGRRMHVHGLGIVTHERPVEGPLPPRLVAQLQSAVAGTGGVLVEANVLHHGGVRNSKPAYLVTLVVECDGRKLDYSATFTSNAELISFVIIPQAGSGP